DLNFYWTLMDSNRTTANVIGAASMPDLTPMASGSIDFALGNVPRNTPNGNWVGRMDEVGISKMPRAPPDMMFTTTNAIIVTSPASQTVPVGAPLNLSVTASGVGPLSYRWRFNGATIAGATQNTYSIPAVQLTDWGNYDVVVTNNVSAVT